MTDFRASIVDIDTSIVDEVVVSHCCYKLTHSDMRGFLIPNRFSSFS